MPCYCNIQWVPPPALLYQCRRKNEIRKATLSRYLGFFVDYGCVEITFPLLCQKEFILKCKISFKEWSKSVKLSWVSLYGTCFSLQKAFDSLNGHLLWFSVKSVNFPFLFVSECWVPRRVLTDLEKAEISCKLFMLSKVLFLDKGLVNNNHMANNNWWLRQVYSGQVYWERSSILLICYCF